MDDQSFQRFRATYYGLFENSMYNIWPSCACIVCLLIRIRLRMSVLRCIGTNSGPSLYCLLRVSHNIYKHWTFLVLAKSTTSFFSFETMKTHRRGKRSEWGMFWVLTNLYYLWRPKMVKSYDLLVVVANM